MGMLGRLIRQNLTYDQNQDVNTFETTSRMLGGFLLHAHYLTSQVPDVSSPQDSVYLSKAIDLAVRLLGAYNPHQGFRTQVSNCERRMGSVRMLMVEHRRWKKWPLSSWFTGNELYWLKAEKVDQVLDDNAMGDGLHPIFVDPESDDHFTTPTDIMGRTYYTSILQTSEPYISKHLVSEELNLAKELMKTCWAMCKVTKTGLAPEINWFSVGLQTSILYLGIPPLPRSRDFIEICVVKPFDTHNLQRPELGRQSADVVTHN
ncbi:hypothetical protein PABG_06799 [Paracoccidioides brasiliensis Pb03]|nr:hypothetical protein PABG_06799 [Paracoccidioides brasiliensis Pb03]